MSVLSANKVSDEADESVAETRYVEKWVVQTDSASDVASTILQYPGLPQRGSVYPGDVRALCKRRRPILRSQEQSRKIWDTTIEYSTKEEEEDEEDKQSPLNRPAKWSGSFQQFQAIADKDRDGKAILNTAGDAFDPPLTKDESRPVMTCVKNFAFLNLSFWGEIADSINKNAWGVFGPKQLKVMNVTWDYAFDGPTLYFPTTFSFQINKDGWDEDVLNRGYRQIEAAGEEPKQITVDADIGKVAISEPALLDAAGKVIPKAQLPQAAHYVSAKKYKLKDFSTFNIPTPGSRS